MADDIPASPATEEVGETNVPPTDGTIKPTPDYDPEPDVQQMWEAIKGNITEEEVILGIMARRTGRERQLICNKYQLLHDENLAEKLTENLTGDFKNIAENLLMDAATYDATELGTAMKGFGTNELVLIEILATRNNEQLIALGLAFERLFGTDLEHDMRDEIGGDFLTLCLALTGANRATENVTDLEKAKQDAEELFDAGLNVFGTDEDKFIEILTTQSYEQLKLVFEEYDKLAELSLEQSIESEMSGDLSSCLLSIVRFARSPVDYYARLLYKAMKGPGTDEGAVVRTLISRCDVDMALIKTAFRETYGRPLEEFIQGDFYGGGKEILLTLLGD